MKKEKVSKKKTEGGTYRIECNYADMVFVPSEAIAVEFFANAMPWTDDKFVTLDGKICRPEFRMSWNSVDMEKMDFFCIDHWGMKFSTLRSIWFDRLKLRYGLNSWHYIKLYELG